MSAPLPIKKADEILNEMGELVILLHRYLSWDDERVIAWRDRLDAGLVSGGRSRTFEVLAMLHHLHGDVDGMDRLYERALAAGASSLEVAADRIPVYLNLGFTSKALSDCRLCYSANNLNIAIGLPFVVASGGFSLAARLIKSAELAKIELSHVSQIQKIMQVAQGASMNSFDDTQYAKVLDLAGDVLRENRLFWLERAPRFSFDAEMRCVGFRYRVGVTPEVATALTNDFTNRLIDTGLIEVPVSVRFIGTLSEPNETVAV